MVSCRKHINFKKKAGNYKINKLRTIHKLESEVNLVRRELIARRLMRNYNKHQYFNDDQHGGRNRRSSIDIVLGKAFTLDTCHMQRANIECTDCDAKTCYDRIIPIVLLLAYLNTVFPYSTCVFFVCILYIIKHQIVTAYRRSKQTNQHTKEALVFEIGQGATDIPSGWICISDIILKCYHKIFKGCKIKDPKENIQINANADMFVDNKMSMHNNEDKGVLSEILMQKIQQDASKWGKLIWITGGLLEFTKNPYFLLIWDFQKSGEPIIRHNNKLPKIQWK